MAVASRTCVKAEKFTFSHQIERFSWQIRLRKKNWYSSVGFYEYSPCYCESVECKWVLIIKSYDDVDIMFYLERQDYKKEYQSINVHLTIVDSLNVSPFYASKDIDFTPSHNDEAVMHVKKRDLFNGYFGLNKMRFIPNDTLTLKCEITTYESVDESYEDEDKLEDTTKYVKNEIYEWLLLLLLIVITVGFVVYISLHFVVPYIDHFLPLPRIIFWILTVSCSIILFLIFSLLLESMNRLWYYAKPGGDRTFINSTKSSQLRSQLNRYNDRCNQSDVTFFRIYYRFISIRYMLLYRATLI